MGRVSQLSDCLVPVGAPAGVLDAVPMGYADNQALAGNYPVQTGSLKYMHNDPATALGVSTLTSGTPKLSRLYGWQAATITNIVFSVTTAGATPSGYCGVAMYRESGANLVLASSSVSTTAAFTTTGVQTVALQVAQAVALDEMFWLGALFIGTTGAQITASFGFEGACNANGVRRCANMPASQTAWPTPFAISSLVANPNALLLAAN